MNVQDLLQKDAFLCDCGREHHSDTRILQVGDAAIYDRIPGMLGGIRRVLVISDGNTRPLCGEKVIAALAGAGITVDEAFFNQTDVLIPDEATIAKAEACFCAGTGAVIVAVHGAGLEGGVQGAYTLTVTAVSPVCFIGLSNTIFFLSILILLCISRT